jgi:AraC family transcriptional regulator, transcriptional activator of pobA
MDQISSLDLQYDGQLASFAIKTMEEIHYKQGGIADPPHKHNYYTVIWTLSAKGKHIIDFREYALEPDSLFFVSPNQVHQVITEPETVPSGYVILFTPEFLLKNSISETFISNLKLFRNSDETPPLPVTDHIRPNLQLFVRQINEAFHSMAEWRMESIGAYLKLFLIECNGHCSLQLTDNTQTIEVGRTIIQRFKDLVEQKYTKWHQVKDYADALNITPNYLNEVIRSSVGKTAKEYIQNRLILESKRQYLFTSKSAKEIGFSLGFDDPSHFSKFFKSFTGQSLQEFKETVYQN